MKTCTVNLPEVFMRVIQAFVNLGVYPSRSELIRCIMKDFLISELKFLEELYEESFHECINALNEEMKKK